MMRSRSEPIISHQEVHWIPLPLSRTIPLEEMPYRVWTLYGHCDPNVRPELPIIPVHNHGAFLEDYIHDWTYRLTDEKGRKLFRYASRVTNEGVWVLLEFSEQNPFDSTKNKGKRR